ncbi:chorismate-binding protein [Plantactinospora sp. KLBMP9567]|uniref:chorismate-binding protein n=1 Tax=Plantactinospora sp. KLBMP9567 TaxID=3085900 RepID=UPI0029815305|nr:chorismate-binding protein [Plantactinospora sp. KLBMP9567]MDW5328064.1 chorismate-binding protein [Plantactinospora sp. KLBMP9567]
MTLLNHLLGTIASGADPGPFALLRRDGATGLEVFTGVPHTVAGLADIPLPAGPTGPRTLAVVPYRQVAERGFACVEDGAPLECLMLDEPERVPLTDALAALPELPVPVRDAGFDIADPEYAEIVARVLRDEIGRGEGANFVIHRCYLGTLAGPPLPAALAALRRLLTGERGAYWTFLVYTGRRILVGASPERHVSVEDGLVMMNPISGTLRHPGRPADREELLRFLADPKEIDELYMVLDEELKMMATVAEQGGQVIGPYLKEMAHLTHTEYLLAGRGSRDVREVLRETMFAPTVTGSPMENACRVIARHERRGRGYYAGVLALLGFDEVGRQTLDAPILIRTAEISLAGELRVPVGATLVRHSTAAAEVAETHAKAAGVLTALGLRPEPAAPGDQGRDVASPGDQARDVASPGDQVRVVVGPGVVGVGSEPAAGPAPAAEVRLADDPAVRAALAARNTGLAPFWLEQRTPGATVRPEFAGRRVVVVDGEDTFTGMLAHQLRALGLTVTVRPWAGVAEPGGFDPASADLTVLGPGPGDPGHPTDPKMVSLRGLVGRLLDSGSPTLGVCLGHQMLAARLGLTLHRRATPYQGLCRDVTLFDTVARVGFYSSYTALADADGLDTAYGPVRLARDPVDGAVHALRGPTYAGVQFHPESVLSRDGMAVLTEVVGRLLPTPAGSAPASGASRTPVPGAAMPPGAGRGETGAHTSRYPG